jgi:hypothetical protein
VTAEELQVMQGEIWQFRHWMAEHTAWKNTDTLDAIRFMGTEAWEAMDAFLREKGGYARNHHKEDTLFSELAQCVLMAFTALGEDWMWTRGTQVGYYKSNIDRVMICMGDVYRAYPRGAWADRTEDMIHLIDAYPGMDLKAGMQECMARLKDKHAVKVQ